MCTSLLVGNAISICRMVIAHANFYMVSNALEALPFVFSTSGQTSLTTKITQNQVKLISPVINVGK